MRLIDADALKEYIDAQNGRPFIGCTIGEALKMMVDEQMTIEERKTGKWICSDDLYEYAVCSACKWDSGEAWEYALKRFSFCPNCGADMRGA